MRTPFLFFLFIFLMSGCGFSETTKRTLIGAKSHDGGSRLLDDEGTASTGADSSTQSSSLSTSELNLSCKSDDGSSFIYTFAERFNGASASEQEEMCNASGRAGGFNLSKGDGLQRCVDFVCSLFRKNRHVDPPAPPKNVDKVDKVMCVPPPVCLKGRVEGAKECRGWETWAVAGISEDQFAQHARSCLSGVQKLNKCARAIRPMKKTCDGWIPPTFLTALAADIANCMKCVLANGGVDAILPTR